jgi:hypothetical protein
MAGAELAEFGARYFKTALIKIDRGNAGADFGETEGRGAADAAASACHHANAARQAEPIRRILPCHF